MKRVFLFVLLTFVAAAASSCEPNETSFFVEHVKAVPDPPACTYSVSDNIIPSMTVDLAFAWTVENAFLVKNQLISTEDYNNLDAESNGINVDYYDVSVTVTATNTSIGSSRIDYNQYIAPESEDLLMAQTIPSSMAMDLADELDCLGFSEANYPVDSMFDNANQRTDRRGNPVPRSLGTVYSTIRFFGHSQGGKEVHTQAFTFAVDMCCGCAINWNNCDAACDRYCSGSDESAMCVAGVVSGGGLMDCRGAYFDPQATWADDVCRDENDNVRPCTCDDCSGN
jgi:hypothetical protein